MTRKLREAREEGFTLIELLVVVIIIGILAAIAIPAFLSVRSNAGDATVKSDLRNAVIHMESYYTSNNEYPAALGDLTAGGFEVSTETESVDDAADSTMTFFSDPTADTYCISASHAETDKIFRVTHLVNEPVEGATCTAADV